MQRRALSVRSMYITNTIDITKTAISWLNLLKPSGFFTYHQFEHSEILHGACFAFGGLYGYQNRQRLLLYTSLTDWLL